MNKQKMMLVAALAALLAGCAGEETKPDPKPPETVKTKDGEKKGDPKGKKAPPKDAEPKPAPELEAKAPPPPAPKPWENDPLLLRKEEQIVAQEKLVQEANEEYHYNSSIKSSKAAGYARGWAKVYHERRKKLEELKDERDARIRELEKQQTNSHELEELKKRLKKLEEAKAPPPAKPGG